MVKGVEVVVSLLLDYCMLKRRNNKATHYKAYKVTRSQ